MPSHALAYIYCNTHDKGAFRVKNTDFSMLVSRKCNLVREKILGQHNQSLHSALFGKFSFGTTKHDDLNGS